MRIPGQNLIDKIFQFILKFRNLFFHQGFFFFFFIFKDKNLFLFFFHEPCPKNPDGFSAQNSFVRTYCVTHSQSTFFHCSWWLTGQFTSQLQDNKWWPTANHILLYTYKMLTGLNISRTPSKFFQTSLMSQPFTFLTSAQPLYQLSVGSRHQSLLWFYKSNSPVKTLKPICLPFGFVCKGTGLLPLHRLSLFLAL